MQSKRARPASALTKSITQDVLALLDGPPDALRLERALRRLAKWRAALIENTLASREGRTVLTGPFRGLDYDIRATEGGACARLIGCYEASLAPVLEDIVARSYPVIMDIGCAEGYYAVGLARRMPQTLVLAHDTNPAARKACADLALRNHVAERVRIGGAVEHADFSRCAEAKTLVICDIEGGEGALLNTSKAPGLIAADILVEVHDCFSPGLSTQIAARFASTHHIRKITRAVDMSALPDWMEELSDLDRLLSVWEWRAGPTPWLWMIAHQPP